MAELTDARPRGQRLWQNPIAVKELRSRMRGRRAFVVLTAYLLAMAALITLVYLAVAGATGPASVNTSREAGKAVFAAVLTVQVLLVVFVGPAFTAGAISGEKERQTYDLLRTTLLPARQLVWGKLLSSLGYVFLLIVASIPLQSIAFLLGGLSLSELVISQVLIMVAAVTFTLFGLYCSSLLRSTLAASVATFAGTAFITFIFPLLVILLLVVSEAFLTPRAGMLGEVIVLYGGILLAATNLPATLIVSEMILVNENALFFFNETVGARTLPVLSPWLPFLIIYGLAAVVLFAATVKRIQAIPKQ